MADDFTAVYGAASVDLTLPSHILLVGDSNKLGTMPLEVALNHARRYRQLYPAHQVVLFVSDAIATSSVTSLGAKVVPATEGNMRAPELIASLDNFQRIASIDFFGHSSPWGAALEPAGMDRRLNSLSPGVASLADNFDRTLDPFVNFHGCNGGIFIAPALSQVWGVAVSGGLTGSDFERLHSDGHWYSEIPGLYPNSAWAGTNTRSFASPVSCGPHGCYRMKPLNAPYHGHWGNFTAGLSHLKFFCNFDGDDACERAMARAALSMPSVANVTANSSAHAFSSVVLDILCTTGKTPSAYNSCVQGITDAIARGDLTYSPFKGIPVDCTMTSCNGTLTCDQDQDNAPVAGTCDFTIASGTTTRTTTTDEYLRYLRGFSSIQNGPAPAATWVGSPCEQDTACTFAPGAFCYASSFCSLPCEGLCPDLAGHGTTFCATVGSGGICAIKNAGTATGCSSVEGTSSQTVDRFVGDSGVSDKTADVCLP